MQLQQAASVYATINLLICPQGHALGFYKAYLKLGIPEWRGTRGISWQEDE